MNKFLIALTIGLGAGAVHGVTNPILVTQTFSDDACSTLVSSKAVDTFDASCAEAAQSSNDGIPYDNSCNSRSRTACIEGQTLPTNAIVVQANYAQGSFQYVIEEDYSSSNDGTCTGQQAAAFMPAFGSACAAANEQFSCAGNSNSIEVAAFSEPACGGLATTSNAVSGDCTAGPQSDRVLRCGITDVTDQTAYPNSACRDVTDGWIVYSGSTWSCFTTASAPASATTTTADPEPTTTADSASTTTTDAEVTTTVDAQTTTTVDAQTTTTVDAQTTTTVDAQTTTTVDVQTTTTTTANVATTSTANAATTTAAAATTSTSASASTASSSTSSAGSVTTTTASASSPTTDPNNEDPGNSSPTQTPTYSGAGKLVPILTGIAAIVAGLLFA